MIIPYNNEHWQSLPKIQSIERQNGNHCHGFEEKLAHKITPVRESNAGLTVSDSENQGFLKGITLVVFLNDSSHS